MSQKLPVNGFVWTRELSQFREGFVESYNEESDKGYFLEVDVQYPGKLHELHNDLPFLPGRIKIHKFQKLIANLHDKKEYVIHIRNLRQALNHALILKKFNAASKFNQQAWLKQYSDMNTELRKKSKKLF